MGNVFKANPGGMGPFSTACHNAAATIAAATSRPDLPAMYGASAAALGVIGAKRLIPAFASACDSIPAGANGAGNDHAGNGGGTDTATAAVVALDNS